MSTTASEQHPSDRQDAPALLDSLRLAAMDIKLAHSVFALPFALLAAFLARDEHGSPARFAAQLGLVVVCMVCARTFAMLVNRLADRRWDAMNPRTHRRVIASGRLSVGRAAVVTLAAAGAFVLACAGFWAAFGNPWPILFSLPTLVWIAFYSFTKRFTVLCHFFLGGALALSPLAAAIAVRPGALAEWAPSGSIQYTGFGVGATLALLSGMVLLWVAGFDIIYALQDVEFDRAARLSSIPARLGPRGAIWVSRALHALAFGLLVLAGASSWKLGWLFDSAVGLVGVLLVIEHAVLATRGKAGLDMAFFTLNGVVSCALGVAGIIDLLN